MLFRSLKIKQKHLALEPHIIKHEERKLKSQIKYTKGTDANLIIKLESLVNHRKGIVRIESRATQLARAYLEGKPYSYVEANSRRKEWGHECFFILCVLPRIVAMVQKYGPRELRKIDPKDFRKVIIDWAKVE